MNEKILYIQVECKGSLVNILLETAILLCYVS